MESAAIQNNLVNYCWVRCCFCYPAHQPKSSYRLKDLISDVQYLKGLRINLETFRYKMEVDPNFAIEEFKEEFLGYRDQYSDGSKRLKNDILLTKRRKTKVQEELNAELQDLFED